MNNEQTRALRAAAVTIDPADPASAESQACIQAYFRELQARFEEGFEPGLSTSAHPEELAPPSGWFLLARLDGEAVGCGGLKVTGDGVGEIKRMWVAPSVRGLGVAKRLLQALEACAVQAGLDALQLDTNRSLLEARAMYARCGYVEIARYNENPYADHWFEKRGLQG